MKPRLLFILFIILLGGILIYGEASPEGFGSDQDTKVERETAHSDEAPSEEGLANQEFPSLPKAPETTTLTTRQEVSAPGPLKAASSLTDKDESESVSPPPIGGLTQPGVILQTNIQRQQNGLGFLRGSETLNAMATSKAQDMCAKQYFAHTSPSGAGAGDLADSFGYDYLSVGENLALGPFADDAAVVGAWMGSLGHRANILNSRFTEIGIGVTKCIFDGRSSWLAVQHFGKPASDCRRPDASLASVINEEKASLAEMRGKLLALKAEIGASDPDLDPDYNSKVGSYNSLVKEYNALIGETRGLINQYNSQVTAFNTCAAS